MAAHGTDDVRIPLPSGGSLDAALALPARAERLPGLIVIHEAWGLNDDMRRISARFADNGYVAVAPDLYSDGNRALCLSRTLVDGMLNEGKRTMPTLEAVRAWLADRPEVDAERIGVIGFCMGGGFALMFGARGSVGVASVNYGAVPKNRAHLTGVCPVVASYGADDKQFAKQGRRLEAHLTGLGVPHDVKIYDGVGHSFWSRDAAPSWLEKIPGPMKMGYGEEQAEDAWARTLAFFEAHL
jgi:carboxymethylenebutenolidase